MKRKTWSLLLTAAILSGCVSFEDSSIDFKNGLKKDIRLASDGVRIPLGDLEKYTLDSLIILDEEDPDATIRKLDNGIYGINIKEDIEDVTIDIDEVIISVSDPEIDPIVADFENPAPEKVVIDTVCREASYSTDLIDLDGLNASLPTIAKKQVNEKLTVHGIPDTLRIPFKHTIGTIDIDTVIEIKTPAITDNGTFSDFEHRIQFNYKGYEIDQTVNVKGSDYAVTDTVFNVKVPLTTIDCDFQYDKLPEQIDRIGTIYFGNTDFDRETGQLITLDVDLSQVDELFLNPRYRVKALDIEFPEEFVLKADPEYKFAGETTVSGNRFTLNMNEGSKLDVTFKEGTKRVDKSSPTQLPISFYLLCMNLNQGAIDGTSTIDYSGQASFSMEFEIAGQPCLIGEKDLDMSMEIDKKINVSDLTASTRQQDFELEADTFITTTRVSGLKDIRKINSISFNPDSSYIYLSVSGLDIHPFELADNDINSLLSISLPKLFQLGSECRNSNGEIVGTWTDMGERQLMTVRPEAVLGSTIAIPITGINTSDCIIDEDGVLTTDIEVEYNGRILINPLSEISLRDIQSFGSQNAEIKIWGSLCIDNADVITSVITTDLESSTALDIDESIDDCVLSVKEVDFTRPAAVSARIDFQGIPSTIESINMNGIAIDFPEFLSIGYTGKDERIRLDGHSIVIDGQLDKTELATGGKGFILDGLAIAGLDFTEPIRTVEKDGGKRILINDSIRISGNVSIDNQQINSNELSDITISPTIHIEDMKVGNFRGIVFPEIDPVDETVELDLGDDLDFMNNDANRLVLSNPELTISLTNNFDVPVLMDLSLSSKKADGTWICQEITPDNGTFVLPGCPDDKDERSTTIIISRDDRSMTVSGDTLYVQMSSLPELMSSIPDKVLFNLNARADTSLTEGKYHSADLNRKLQVTGGYEVNIPLTFDDLYVEYTDTIDSLAGSLEDVLDIVSGNVSLEIGGNIESTIPLALTVNATAIDRNGKAISKGVAISECRILPGRDGKSVTSAIKLNATMSEEAMNALDGFVLTVSCTADHTDGGASLNSKAYIQPKDLYLYLPQGIDIELDSDN